MNSLSQGHTGRAGLSPGALFLCGRSSSRVHAAPPLSGLGSASSSWDVRGEFFSRTSGSRARKSLAPCDGVPARPWPCSSLQGRWLLASAPAASPPEASLPCQHILAPHITQVSAQASPLQRGLKEPTVVFLPGGPLPFYFLHRTLRPCVLFPGSCADCCQILSAPFPTANPTVQPRWGRNLAPCLARGSCSESLWWMSR